MSIRRLYAGYSDSTSPTTGQTDEFIPFRLPSTSLTTWRATTHGDPAVQDLTLESDGSGGIRIVANFANPADPPQWFHLDATCNVVKQSGQPGYTRIGAVWRLNGSNVGPVRYFDINGQTVISGTGAVQLSHGDTLVPHISVDSADNQVVLQSCSFMIRED